jgi:YVTN family beta-propeller protein
MPPLHRYAAVILLASLVAACGGGGGSQGSEPGPVGEAPSPMPPPPPARCDAPAKTVAALPAASTPIVFEKAGGRVWVANPDNDSVSLIDPVALRLLAEIPVGDNPRTLAVAGNGCIWVANHDSANVSVIDPDGLAVAKTVALPRASQPFGLVVSPADGAPWVALEALGRVLRIDPATGAVTHSIEVGANPRHLSVTASGERLLVSRFISPLLPGEATANPQAQVGGVAAGGEVVVVDVPAGQVAQKVVLGVSDRTDSGLQARGIPNYLGAAAIAPDGASAWVPSKQDNVMRGALRDGLPLDFQSTVRAISSRILLGDTPAEDAILRVDHDNSGVATAAAFHPTGDYLFVALETTRDVALVDPSGGREILRLPSGFAPQGIAVSPDGQRLFVSNFMGRSVSVFDLSQLLDREWVTRLGEVKTATAEKLPPQVLAGKRLFYDALDTRLARDGYLSCASCHADGGGDGRVWDFTGFGEGLRRTISLRGRAGSGPLHWSANFDELQDFEGQIRDFAGGQGLMADPDFATRSQPLGAPKAGVSPDLDALAAYMASLDRFAPSPWRKADGTLTAEAEAGRALFAAKGCASCHGGKDFDLSTGASPGDLVLHDVGTIKPSSGGRLGGALTGIDTPTLRDAWAAGAWLHDGSAGSVGDAIAAHNTGALGAEDLRRLAAYVREIGAED